VVNETLFCFLDDIDYNKLAFRGKLPVGSIFGIAGFVVTASNLKTVIKEMHKAKRMVGLGPDDPIKHSMDSEIRRVYHDLYGTKGGDAKFKIAKSNARSIGAAALGGLKKADAKVLGCLNWPYAKTGKVKQTVVQWAFENLMQRIGFLVKKPVNHPSLVVVMDRPIAPEFLKSFREGYYRARTTDGQPYFCGALDGKDALDTLMFAATSYSNPLQVADFVSRACRDFVSWCHDGKTYPSLFLPVVPVLHRDSKGKVAAYGLKINPDPGFSVDDKIDDMNKAKTSSP
jgi:hypothetical protein